MNQATLQSRRRGGRMAARAQLYLRKGRSDLSRLIGWSQLQIQIRLDAVGSWGRLNVFPGRSIPGSG